MCSEERVLGYISNLPQFDRRCNTFTRLILGPIAQLVRAADSDLWRKGRRGILVVLVGTAVRVRVSLNRLSHGRQIIIRRSQVQALLGPQESTGRR